MDEIASKLPISPKRRFFAYVNFVYVLSSLTLERFKKVVRADPEILAFVMFEQYWGKITHLPLKRTFFWKFFLHDFYLPIILYILQRLKKVLGILTQTHRDTNNNKSFDLIITDQICFVKSVSTCVTIFLYLPFTVLSSFLY